MTNYILRLSLLPLRNRFSARFHGLALSRLRFLYEHASISEVNTVKLDYSSTSNISDAQQDY